MVLRSGVLRGHSRDKPRSLSGSSTQKENRNFGEDEFFSERDGLDNFGSWPVGDNPAAAWFSFLVSVSGRGDSLMRSNHLGNDTLS